MQIDSPKLQHPSAFQHSTVSNAHPASSLFTSSNMAGTTLASSPSPASTRPSPAQDRDHTQSAKYRGIELPGGHGGKAAGAPESVPQAKHEESDDMQNSSAGPVRTQKGQKSLSDEKNSKAIAAPVKSACTFCRSRKSRCDGGKPCAACVARGRTDDCHYTVSRRGGKPKSKAPPEDILQSHLDNLFSLAELPRTVRKEDVGSSINPSEQQSVGTNWASLSNGGGLQGAFGVNTTAPSGSSSVPDETNLINSNIFATIGATQGLRSSRADDPVSRRALLVDYYKYLYRFIPVMPPPSQLDASAATMSASSPFLLALQCVLPLLQDEEQPPGPLHGLAGGRLNFGTAEKKHRVREITQYFERMATEAIDKVLEREDSERGGEGTLEVIQALCVLTIYEYGSGRALKARLKADQALGLAMAKGLHRLTNPAIISPNGIASPPSSFAHASANAFPFVGSAWSSTEVYEMRKRCWWTVWSLVLWAAYNTGRIPTIRADDPRVQTEMPACSDPDAWPANVRSLQALLLVQDRVLALSNLEHSAQSSGSTAGGTPPIASPGSTFSPAPTHPQASAQSPFTPVFPTVASSAQALSFTGDGEGSNTAASLSRLPAALGRQAILNSMLEIDKSLQEQIALIERRDLFNSYAKGSGDTDLDNVEDELITYLHTSSAIQLYTSSLTLHIGQAFQGASLFERKLCFLNSINENSDPAAPGAACREPMPNAFFDEFANVAGSSSSADAAPAWTGQPNVFGAGLESVDPQWASIANSNGGAQGAPGATSEGSGNGTANRAEPTTLDLYARGPFLPRLSLQRCVTASQRLLAIARRKKRQEPNPFNACSYVLISFTFLMQALVVHGGFHDDSEFEETDQLGDTQMSEDGQGELGQGAVDNTLPLDFLKSAQGASALDALLNGSDFGVGASSNSMALDWPEGTDSSATGETPAKALKRAQLHEIWRRVQEARDTLAELSKHWDMVVPMADEVNLCLETSQVLLSQP